MSVALPLQIITFTRVTNFVPFASLKEQIMHELQGGEFLSLRTLFHGSKITKLTYFELPVILGIKQAWF